MCLAKRMLLGFYINHQSLYCYCRNWLVGFSLDQRHLSEKVFDKLLTALLAEAPTNLIGAFGWQLCALFC